MTPTVVGVPPTHPCRRCEGRAPTAGAWCSATCQRIELVTEALPKVCTGPGRMSLGPKTAVIHALPWLDARARVVA